MSNRISTLGPLLRAAALGLALVLPGTGALAQDDPASATLVEPSYATALIRDVLAAVNHGNWTGNYTVLRDYAAPEFAQANDPTRLAGLFTDIRAEGLDLLPVMSADPVLLDTQLSDSGRELRLTGYFPLQPRHVSFDLIFGLEGRRWLLLGVSVGAFDAIEKP